MPSGRPKELNESKRELNRVLRRLQPRLDRQISTFPDGEHVVIARCMRRDKRTAAEEPYVKIIGSGDLLEGVESCRDSILDFVREPEEPEEPIDTVELERKKLAKASKYLEMPSTALARSKKLRKMLRKLWKLEGHFKTKQIYKAVQNEEAGFAWWAGEFPDIPFTNLAVESADASKRIFQVVAPKLYKAKTGKKPPSSDGDGNGILAQVEVKVEQCRLSGFCTRPNRHVGLCNHRKEAMMEQVAMDTSPQVIGGEGTKEESSTCGRCIA